MAIPFIFCCFFENAAGKLLSLFEMGHIFLLIRFSPWIEDLTDRVTSNIIFSRFAPLLKFEFVVKIYFPAAPVIFLSQTKS